MEIQHSSNESKGEFFIEKDGNRIGEMTYSKANENKIIIDHTEVSKEARGQGYGEQLVKEGVEFARENNLKIIPLCPFAKNIIEETPEFRDVL